MWQRGKSIHVFFLTVKKYIKKNINILSTCDEINETEIAFLISLF